MTMTNTHLWNISEKLLCYDTVSFVSNSQAASFIANELTDLGFTTHIDSYDLNGTRKDQVVGWIGPEVIGGLILSGHIDTVPFENQKGWNHDPLNMTLDKDKIYGRGTTDMKLFIAHCLAAFKEMDLTKLDRPLVCIFTSDEEVGCLGANKVATQLDRILGEMPVPTQAIIGEPTEFNIINTHKGIVQFDAIIKGKPGHSSRPDLGKNAIELARLVIQATESLNQKYKFDIRENRKKTFPDFACDHLHLAQINGGEATNMIPSHCHLKYSYRFFPEDDPKAVMREFQDKIINSFLSPEAVDFILKRITKAMPRTSNKHLEKVLKELTQGELISANYTTDGGEFSQVGIETYICGPGSIQQAHMPDEYITVDQYQKGPEFVQGLVTKLLID